MSNILPVEQKSGDLKLVFTAMPGSSILLLPDAPVFTVIAVTDSYLNDTGSNRDDLVGKGLFEAFPGNDFDPDKVSQKAVQASLEYVLQHKELHRQPVHRYDVIGGNGLFEERYWSANNKPVLNQSGEVIYLIHTISDVTEQMEAQHREVRFRNIEKAYDLFMQAPVAICIVKGPDYIVELANAHMLTFLGRTEEMIGKPIINSLPEAALQGLIGILDLVYTTGAPYHTSNFPALILIDGIRQQRYFDLVFKPYFENEGDVVPASIFCVAHNVTKQILYQKNMEESEHRFRMLIEEATVATGLYIGKELLIQYANDILLSYGAKIVRL